MKRTLVIGSKGQLGQEIKFLTRNSDSFEYEFVDKEELDITKKSNIEKYLKSVKYDFVVNCAAYTAVDKAEEDSENALLLNSTAVSYLAEICSNFNINLIHISTDFVFSGYNYIPYKENDACAPLSEYGMSKLKGEIELQKINPKSIIIRTSWLYSSFGNNFIKTIIRLSKERKELNVVYDQVGTPTYARDLANTILEIIRSEKFNYGIYHFSNEGVCSWYDFAVEVVRYLDLNIKIYPIETKDYKLPATRPNYSVLNKEKIKTIYNIDIPHWVDSLKKCLDTLK